MPSARLLSAVSIYGQDFSHYHPGRGQGERIFLDHGFHRSQQRSPGALHSAATKKRIEKAAKKLGYRPNLFARSLRSKRSHTVGVMVFDMTDPYCTLVLRGIENSLYQSSYLPILTDVHNERSRFERYLEMLLDRRVEALIVLANWLFVDIDVLADLEKSSIPTRDDRPRTANRYRQLGDRGQRNGSVPRGRASALAGTPQDRLHPRAQDSGRQRSPLAGNSFVRQKQPAWNSIPG